MVSAPTRPLGLGRWHRRPLHPLLEHNNRSAPPVRRHRLPGVFPWSQGSALVCLRARHSLAFIMHRLVFFHSIVQLPWLTRLLSLPLQVCNLAWSKTSNELVSTHGYSQHQIVVWKYPTMVPIATLTGTYRNSPCASLSRVLFAHCRLAARFLLAAVHLFDTSGTASPWDRPGYPHGALYLTAALPPPHTHAQGTRTGCCTLPCRRMGRRLSQGQAMRRCGSGPSSTSLAQAWLPSPAPHLPPLLRSDN